MNVLIVEDNAAIARAIEKSLRAHGHAISVVGSAAAARSASDAFDVGVFDISLPDGDGIDLAEELLAERLVRHVLFFSGVVDDDMIDRAKLTGRVLPKDQSFSDLHRVILEMAGGS